MTRITRTMPPPAATPPPARETRAATPAHPVVIVGAGPVGMTLALGLAREGVRTLVLEKRGPDGTRESFFNLTPTTFDNLAAVGATEALAAIRPVTRVVVDDEVRGRVTEKNVAAGNQLPADASRAGGGVPALVDALENRDGRPWGRIAIGDLEDALRRQAATNPLIEVRYGTGVSAVEQTDRGVRVLTGGDGGGGGQAIEAALLVNASGSRPLPGVRQSWVLDPQVNNFLGARYAGTPTVESRFRLAPDEPGGQPHMSVALTHPSHTMVWAHVPDAAASYDPATADRIVRERARELGFTADPAGPPVPLSFRVGRVERAVDGRVMGIGDAVRIPYFRTSTGANTGIGVDVPLAIDTIRRVLGGADASAELAAYDAAIQRANDVVLEINRRQMAKDVAGER